jgi:DUF1680 family protein
MTCDLRFRLIAALLLIGGLSTEILAQQAKTEFLDPADVMVNGILGEALTAARKGRLTSLPTWNNGQLINIFSKDVRDQHDKMDWYGEHAGKWMYSAAIAVRQSKDEQLKTLLLKTADELVSFQAPDGYLGDYGPTIRITSTTTNHRRSWDTWNLTYMTLGLLEVNRYFPNEKYLAAAKNIGELFLKTFGEGKADVTKYGTRYGISATILLDATIELYKTTLDKRYLDFSEWVVRKMEETEGIKLVAVATNNGDMELVGDGKAYQVLWNLTNLAKLYELTGKAEYLKAVENAWANVRDFHLTIAGGPWGGVGKHLECFNRKGYWTPYGFVETCSTMQWIELNKQMLHLTGDSKYAQEIERSAYNALLGARYTNGVDWSYHSFTNGSWHVAHFNDCCPSSGVMALEELVGEIFSKRENGIAVNLITDASAKVGKSQISVKTNYPFDGKVEIKVTSKEKLPIFIRIPDWATNATIDGESVKAGEYFKVDRAWKEKDVVILNFPIELKLHQAKEDAPVPQGKGEDIYSVNWFALSRGPLVFSTNGLIDNKDRERTFVLPANLNDVFKPVASPYGSQPAYEMTSGDGKLLFVPYYEAGGAKLSNWRLTWIQTKIE